MKTRFRINTVRLILLLIINKVKYNLQILYDFKHLVCLYVLPAAFIMKQLKALNYFHFSSFRQSLLADSGVLLYCNLSAFVFLCFLMQLAYSCNFTNRTTATLQKPPKMFFFSIKFDINSVLVMWVYDLTS